MIDKIMKKLISIYEYKDTKLSVSINIIAILITYFITKLFASNVIISIFICVTVILALGFLVQILRKDRNTKMIASYGGGTLFSIFVTVIGFLINKYSNTNNNAMLAIVIKIFICVMALLVDIIGIIFIMNKGVEKKRKIMWIVGMVYFTFIAIVIIAFFASKGV